MWTEQCLMGKPMVNFTCDCIACVIDHQCFSWCWVPNWHAGTELKRKNVLHIVLGVVPCSAVHGGEVYCTAKVMNLMCYMMICCLTVMSLRCQVYLACGPKVPTAQSSKVSSKTAA